SPTTTSPTRTYTLSLHDALPICGRERAQREREIRSDSDGQPVPQLHGDLRRTSWPFTTPRCLVLVNDADSTVTDVSLSSLTSQSDRKSTRLNSSHVAISYAVFCL